MVHVQKREGVVCEINQGDVVVRLQQLSACTGCHAKEFCCSTDCAERYLRVPRQGETYEIGEKVLILGEDRLGRLAVFLSFVLPIFVLLSGLVLGIYALGLSEPVAVLVAIGFLALYYLVLRLCEGRLRRIMVFRLEKFSSLEVSDLGLASE